jgi:hypothetical protein
LQARATESVPGIAAFSPADLGDTRVVVADAIVRCGRFAGSNSSRLPTPALAMKPAQTSPCPIRGRPPCRAWALAAALGGRVHFEASVPAAEQAGLKLSARLLAVAGRVVPP